MRSTLGACLGLLCAVTIARAQDRAAAQQLPPELVLGKERPCDLWSAPPLQAYYRCTPRVGVLSGGLIGMDVGVITLDEQVARRSGAGPGVAIDFRFGLTFLDLMTFNFSGGGLQPHDRTPFTEADTKSRISAGFIASDIGLQYRLRPWSWTSITAGVGIGYLYGVSEFERFVDGCDVCRRDRLDIAADGFYLVPLLRITGGHNGLFALLLRTRWFFTGDIARTIQVGIETGLP